MSREEYLVDKLSILKKFKGKGGWTYTEVPEIAQNPDNPFGWVTVCGFIDDYELKNYKLMPMGNGKLFLPVNAKARKVLGKGVGDEVHVRLRLDDSPIEIPQELIECLMNESENMVQTFKSLTSGKQKYYLDWIYQAKTENTKADRIVQLIEDLYEVDQ